MIIAHLPAGYLLTKALMSATKTTSSAGLWFCGLLASVLPDFDILWFYLEGGVRSHRCYPTHWPLFWLALFGAAAAVLLMLGKRKTLIYPAVMLANVLLHLVLDGLAGPVLYAAPFSEARIQLIRIPALYDWWVWNFIRHWIFQVEVMIWGVAALVYGLSSWEGRPSERAGDGR